MERKLRSTDTKAVPNEQSYIKDSKYDRPQKNARKINWDDDEDEQQAIYQRWNEDSKLMPPPPPSSPPPPLSETSLPHPPLPVSPISYPPCVNPQKGSPHPKKFKRSHNTIKTIECNTKSMTGKCPEKIIMLLFDEKNNVPLRVMLNISDFSYHFFNVLESIKNTDFEVKVNDIILYSYKFIENNFEHPVEVINEEIGNKSLKICEEKKLSPYNDNDEDDKLKFNEYNKEIYEVKYGVMKFNKGEKLIVCNDLIFTMISNIVDHIKKIGRKIIYDKIGELISFKKANELQKIILS
tara:strand:- start:5345 stop:6229 length:885 start_codon:yes stop_codon:yes gene_type:complete